MIGNFKKISEKLTREIENDEGDKITKKGFYQIISIKLHIIKLKGLINKSILIWKNELMV